MSTSIEEETKKKKGKIYNKTEAIILHNWKVTHFWFKDITKNENIYT